MITGHTGVADKALFTRLTELRKGDVFYVRVAAQTLAYKVERIRKVDPDDLRDVRIQPGRDLVTLVTCTPIFLNTYRLLVTGERVSMPDDAPYPEDAPKTSRRDMRPYLVSGVTLLAGLPRRSSRPGGKPARTGDTDGRTDLGRRHVGVVCKGVTPRHRRQADTPMTPISDWGHVECLTETSQGCFHWSRIHGGNGIGG